MPYSPYQGGGEMIAMLPWKNHLQRNSLIWGRYTWFCWICRFSHGIDYISGIGLKTFHVRTQLLEYATNSFKPSKDTHHRQCHKQKQRDLFWWMVFIRMIWECCSQNGDSRRTGHHCGELLMNELGILERFASLAFTILMKNWCTVKRNRTNYHDVLKSK